MKMVIQQEEKEKEEAEAKAKKEAEEIAHLKSIRAGIPEFAAKDRVLPPHKTPPQEEQETAPSSPREGEGLARQLIAQDQLDILGEVMN